MSDVVVCNGCGRLFRTLVRGRCGECLERLEHDYETVRDYLRENPSARLRGTAEATGVHPNTIMEFVNDGRLEFAQVATDVRADEDRRRRIAESLGREVARQSAPAGAAPSRPSPALEDVHGMATRRIR